MHGTTTNKAWAPRTSWRQRQKRFEREYPELAAKLKGPEALTGLAMLAEKIRAANECGLKADRRASAPCPLCGDTR